MQIFMYDFATRTKGAKIDDKRLSGNGCKIGKVGKTGVFESFTSIEYVNGEPEFTDHTASDYGVEAIIMCTGKSDGVWRWIIVPSDELVEKGKARNLAKFGVEYYKGESK